MFQVRSWPNVILHLDGDAFFASVAQATNLHFKGKPLVVGKERGIATAVSYEAKKIGIKRGMRIFDIKRLYPDCILVESDFYLYELFSQKIQDIISSFTPQVEQYSVDEWFADIKGLRRPYNMSYFEIGAAIKRKIEASLGITVSVGISLTKSLAKLASSFKKPSGLVMVDGLSIEKLLKNIALEKIWGIGENTASYLKGFNINTALEFAHLSEDFIKAHLTKSFYEIWRELHGEKVYELNIYGKTTTKSITRSATFTPTTKDINVLFSKLLGHVEDAFVHLRKLNYQAGFLTIFLKTQQFRYLIGEIKLRPKISYPWFIHKEIKEGFKKIYNPQLLYRTTGCTVGDIEEIKFIQPGLFTDKSKEDKIKRVYPLLTEKKVDFGTVLFDKDRMLANKKEKQFSIPVINL